MLWLLTTKWQILQFFIIFLNKYKIILQGINFKLRHNSIVMHSIRNWYLFWDLQKIIFNSVFKIKLRQDTTGKTIVFFMHYSTSRMKTSKVYSVYKV